MSTEINPQPSRQDGYERRDANTRVLLHYGFWLGVVLVVVLITMKWTFDYLSAKDPLGPPPTPFENARALPPQPQLQVQPHQDLKAYCEEEKNDRKLRLGGFAGWRGPHSGGSGDGQNFAAGFARSASRRSN